MDEGIHIRILGPKVDGRDEVVYRNFKGAIQTWKVGDGDLGCMEGVQVP